MTEPKSVRIGPFDYEIRWFDQADEDAHKKFGLFQANAQIICLPSERKRQRVASTFWHEVTHGINHVYGPEEKGGMVNEEHATGSTGYGVTAFVRDNPDAMAWFIDLATRDPATQYQRGMPCRLDTVRTEGPLP